jgi:NADPH:quinone reductase-like Zn-dependent oxidoreductase
VIRRWWLLPIALSAFVAAGSTPAAAPDTMLAAAIDHGGGPEVITIHLLPVPKPAPGEVLIQVHAAGVGVWEQRARQSPDADTHFPLILGSDGAGIVTALGAGVHRFKVGDQVYGTSEAFYAEYVTARADDVAPVPKGIGLTEAGVLAISGLSALQGIDDVLQVKARETVLIHGAAGAVGALAIQFAKLRGARVIATASDDARLALVKSLGADAAINGRTGDITAAIRQWAPEGVDAVLALVGGDTLERCIDALRTDGRGRVAYLYGMRPLPQPRFAARMTLYTYVAGVLELERLNTAVESAKLRVPIGAEYPLAGAADAHRRLEAGHLLGKIVLKVQ